MILIADFTVPGQPLPKGRPQFAGHAYTPKATKDAEALVASSFTDGIGVTHSLDQPTDSLLKVVLRFYREDNRTADLDNLTKMLLDGLNKKAWRDDKQIKDLHARYFVDRDNPRTEVEIWALDSELVGGSDVA